MNYTMKLSKKLSFGEEIANSVTHAVGALLMLILLPISAVYSFEQHSLLSAFGTSIFVISLFLMFLSSTVYHAMSYDSPQKYVLRIIDHSMIYIAIAGSSHRCPYLDEQLDGLQHYFDPMGDHHLWYSLQNLCQKSQ